MSSGAKQIVAYAPETTAGVLPEPFNRQALRFTGFSLDGAVTGTESDEITENWMSSGEYKTGIEFAGELNGQLSWQTYDDLLAAAFHNTWTADSLILGTLQKTFSFVRGYKDAGGYHIFSGVSVVGLTIDVPEEGIIGVTFTLQGRNRKPVTFTLPAGTVTAANKNKLMTNVGVGDVTIDGQPMADVACATAFSLSMEFSYNAQKCFGKGLSVGKIIENGVTITGSVTLAWGDEAAALNELKYNNSSIALKIPLSDDAGNTYTIEVPEATISGEMPSGSRGDLLQYTLNFTARTTSPKLTRKAAAVTP
jgi:hypothetical protein